MIGMSLTLELFDSDSNSDKRYRCKVVEKEGTTLYIDYPIDEKSGRTSIFSKGTIFSASFVGKDKSVYKFETEIMGKKQSNIPMLILHYPEGRLVRIQRREYVRVMTTVDVSVHDSFGGSPPFTTVTHDMSGGGISILVTDDYICEQGKLLDVWLVLIMASGEINYINAVAEVIRLKEQEERKSNILSLKLAKIADRDRQLIVKYCFESQLRNRKRGLT